jgi:parallel beta-helix repeat protein
MRRKSIFGTALALLIVSFFALPLNIIPVRAAGGTIYIKADGSVDPSTAPIQNVGNVYYTLTADIYDQIWVQRSNIVVDGNGHKLDGAACAYPAYGFCLSGVSNVTIKGTRITNYDYGIYLFTSPGNTLHDNTVTNNTDGIWIIWQSHNNTLYGNTVTNNEDDSIYVYSNGNTLFGNTLTGNGQGISLNQASNNTVYSNTVMNSFDGIFLYKYSDNNTVHDNTVTNNYYGIRLQTFSDSNAVYNNIVKNNTQYCGVYLGASNDNTVSNNTVVSNKYGIRMDYWYDSSTGTYYACNENIVSRNNVTNNGYWGIYLLAGRNNIISENYVSKHNYGIYITYLELLSAQSKLSAPIPLNLIYHNNLVNNNVQAYSINVPNTWDNGYPSGGNYWSDYNGTDANHDGIGDTPYVIDANNQDRYPLMNPWIPQSTWTLTVHAQKTLGGKPIQGANVTVYEDSTLIGSALTDENGNTVFQVPAGTYTIIAKHHLLGPIYLTKQQTVEISKDTTVIFKFII